MKNRFVTFMLILIFLASLTGNAQAISSTSPDLSALIFVRIVSPDDLNRFVATQLPIFSMLDGGLLTAADLKEQRTIRATGLNYQVLDPDLRAGTYYMVENRQNRLSPDFDLYGTVLLNTANGTLLRMDPSHVDALIQTGTELKRITLTSKPLPAVQNVEIFPEVVDPDPLIQGMIDQVTQEQVYTYTKQLAGELPVWVDDDWYTITTRYTYSGDPIEKTTHYVHQHMLDLGLDVEYHWWDDETNPNVIGEIPGLTNPENIFIIGGHIDAVPGSPGADDNASGSVATLLAADIFSQYQWGCTMRFALWTGEEQGLLGSAEYAQQAYQNGENILGYINLDMIAWNTIGSQPGIDLYYEPSLPPTLQLAQLFVDVVDAYNINLLPQIDWGVYASDHASFWDYGYTSILGIEDFNDFNDYYHSPNDTPANTDPAYFTDFVKASIATYAHMSDCLIPGGEGALEGHVTAASGGEPLEGVSIIADDGQGNTYPDITDPTGYYTITLPAGTYTATATLDGYIPQSQSASIAGGLTTTLDFSLQPVCEPVSGLDFSWIPIAPFSGDLITFTSTATGTEPIDFLWNFGDTITDTGQTVTHVYGGADTYTVSVQAMNACGDMQVSKDIVVLQQVWQIFLPVVKN